MIRNLTLFLSVLIATSAVTVGPWVLRKLNQAFTVDVEELPGFPIVLKPYRSLMALYLSVGSMCIVGSIFIAALCRDIAALMIFALPSFLIAVVAFISAYLYSRQSIIIDAEKLIYKKVGKEIVVNFPDIIGFSVITGYLNLQRKSDGSTAKISLYFKNIRYLNAVLKKWFTRKIV